MNKFKRLQLAVLTVLAVFVLSGCTTSPYFVGEQTELNLIDVSSELALTEQDGNWYIDGVDTGLEAADEDQEDYYVMADEEGNLFVGLADSKSIYEVPIGVEEGWGWLQWIITQIAMFVYLISDSIGGGYIAVGLIVVTLLVRLVGWPIYAKSNATTVNMQRAQPELDELKEKYRGKTDEASQKKMQQEQMEIWRKYDINPLGCLLPFLQMPIFIAMYQVVRRMPLLATFYLGDATNVLNFRVGDMALKYGFLWIEDLGGADPYYILPALVGIIMFFSQRYATKKPEYLQNKKYGNAGENQQRQSQMMQYVMVFLLVSIAMTNAGIALYWVFGNSMQFLQTYVTKQQNKKKYEEEQNKSLVRPENQMITGLKKGDQ